MQLKNILYSLKQYGVAQSAFYGAYRVAHQASELMILRMLTLTSLDLARDYCRTSRRFEFTFLDQKDLLHFADGHVLTEGFIEEAMEKDDECYAVIDGDRLASFTWYTQGPGMLHGDLFFRRLKGYRHAYHSYTYPEYRGRRLQATGLARAMTEFSNQGGQGIVADVEVTNYRSLRGFARVGFKPRGTVAVVRIGGSYYTYASRDALANGFDIFRGDGVAIPELSGEGAVTTPSAAVRNKAPATAREERQEVEAAPLAALAT